MNDLASLQGLLIVVEAALASVVLPPLAWLLCKTYRRRAAGRRLVWVTAFAMLLALPLLAMVAPSLAVIALPAQQPSPVAEPVAAAPIPDGFGWWSLLPLIIAVWLAGLGKLGVQHLASLVRLELMRHRAARWPLPLRLRGCELKVSEECPGPMTWGVLRPVILLPDEALDWPPAKLAIVLRHEMAHVRRRDGLAQAMALVACALYWPNPLVWGAARALRRECELAADDAVIASGLRPSDYAGQLLELASEWRERRLTPTGLAMAAPPALSQRVQSILSTDAIRTGVSAMDTLKLALLGGAATAALTLARPSVAEVPAPATTAQQAAPAAEPRPAPAPGPAPAASSPAPTREPFVRRTVSPSRERDPSGPARLVRRDRDAAYVANDDTVVAVLLDDAGAKAPGNARIDVQPAPPAPPAPPAVSAPPAPPAPPAPRVHVVPRFQQGQAMTPEQRAELERNLAQIGPTIDKAIADAHIDETVQSALAAQDAKTREMVAKQLAEIGPMIQRAIEGAHVRELVQQRLAQLGPEFEAQRRQAQERAAQAEERVAAQLEEQAKRARERAKRDRQQLNAAPQPAQPPKN